MPASTFEQLIATHSPMIARHDMRPAPDFTTAEFIDTIASLGRTYSTGATSSLQDAADNLTAAATYLTDAGHDTTHANILIGLADKHLHDVNDLALA